MRKFLLSALTICSSFCWAGIFDAIDSDRPGQCISPKTAGFTTLQVQSGFTFGYYNAEPFGFRSNFLSETTTLRVGLLPKIELNTTIFWSGSKYKTDSTDYSALIHGFPSPDIGLRIELLQGDGWKPDVGFQANMRPSSSRGTYQQGKWGSSLILSTRNKLFGGNYSLNTNWSMAWPGSFITSGPFYRYAVNFGFPLSSKISGFVEVYGNLVNNFDYNVDAGFSYLITNDLMIDISGGHNLAEYSTWFVEAGFSWKINLLQKYLNKKMSQFLDGWSKG